MKEGKGLLFHPHIRKMSKNFPCFQMFSDVSRFLETWKPGNLKTYIIYNICIMSLIVIN